MDDKLYSTEEADALLEVTPARVRQMIAAGILSTRKVGKVHLITNAGINQARLRRTQPGPAPKGQPTQAKKDAKKASKK